MSIAQHAQRILAAWNVADPEKFETELQNALHCCKKKPGSNILEIEQQELLETVVERLRLSGNEAGEARRKSSAQGLSAGFALLQHLSHRAAA
jgi:hypothetical protein